MRGYLEFGKPPDFTDLEINPNVVGGDYPPPDGFKINFTWLSHLCDSGVSPTSLDVL